MNPLNPAHPLSPLNPVNPMNPLNPMNPMRIARRNKMVDATTDMVNNLTGNDILLAVGIAVGITLVMAAIVYIFVKKTDKE